MLLYDDLVGILPDAQPHVAFTAATVSWPPQLPSTRRLIRASYLLVGKYFYIIAMGKNVVVYVRKTKSIGFVIHT